VRTKLVIGLVALVLVLGCIAPVSSQGFVVTSEEIQSQGQSKTLVYAGVGAAIGFTATYALAECYRGYCLIGAGIGGLLGYLIGSQSESRGTEHSRALYTDHPIEIPRSSLDTYSCYGLPVINGFGECTTFVRKSSEKYPLVIMDLEATEGGLLLPSP
jgi:hypothetical protein